MKLKLSIAAIFISLSVGVLYVNAADNQVNHTAHTDHSAMIQTPQALQMSGPSEGGQAGFTAIAEIVQLLNDDPNTDWSKVSIDRFRAHLVDMNELTIHAQVAQVNGEGSVTFTISGIASALKAAKNMVLAHAV